MRSAALTLPMRASASTIVVTCLLFALDAEASLLSSSYQDAVDESESTIGLTATRFRFDDPSGWYEIAFTASRVSPFVGAFRRNVNLANVTLGDTPNWRRAGFRDAFNDFDIASHRAGCNIGGGCRIARRRTLVLAGTNRNLTSRRGGDRILALEPTAELATGVFDLPIIPASLAADSDPLPPVAVAVPEPATALLFGLGLAACSVAGRRSRT